MEESAATGGIPTLLCVYLRGERRHLPHGHEYREREHESKRETLQHAAAGLADSLRRGCRALQQAQILQRKSGGFDQPPDLLRVHLPHLQGRPEVEARGGAAGLEQGGEATDHHAETNGPSRWRVD